MHKEIERQGGRRGFAFACNADSDPLTIVEAHIKDAHAGLRAFSAAFSATFPAATAAAHGTDFTLAAQPGGDAQRQLAARRVRRDLGFFDGRDAQVV